MKGVVGIDEAGRGALAGPVVIAAVSLHKEIDGLMDSKQLSPKRRDALYEEIIQTASCRLSIIGHRGILKRNILGATLYGMKRAMLKLPQSKDFPVYIDGNKRPPGIPDNYRVEVMVKADQKVPAVSAASIVAKVVRDRLMMKYDRIYPNYAFARHKGYGTALHYDRLFENGPCPIHRRGFQLGRQGTLFDV